MSGGADPGAGCPSGAGRGRSRSDDLKALFAHYLGGCPACRDRLAREIEPPPDLRGLGPAIGRALDRTPALIQQVAAEKRAAARFLARLEGAAEERQRLVAANAPPRLRRAVCEALVERARGQRHVSVAATLRYAELAVAAAGSLPPGEAADARARAWAELGNARRIASDLAGAGAALKEAERIRAAEGSDPLLEPELLSLRGSLADYERRFREAVRALARAARLCASFGDHRGEARCLLQLAGVRSRAGRPRAGFEPAVRAFRIAHAAEDRHLLLIATQKLIHLALEAGDADLAWTWAQEARPLFERAAPPLDRLRFDWLASRVQAELGLQTEAAAALDGLRARYAAEGLPFEAALISLDLAGIYARLGRRRDLRRLARECVALFRSIGVAREAIVSLALLAQAEQAEAAALLADLAAAVRRAPRSAAP